MIQFDKFLTSDKDGDGMNRCPCGRFKDKHCRFCEPLSYACDRAAFYWWRFWMRRRVAKRMYRHFGRQAWWGKKGGRK